MLYNLLDYIKFSLIYSQETPLSLKPKLKLKLVTNLLQTSQKTEINLFSCSRERLTRILEITFPEPRYYQLAKDLFLDQKYQAQLTEQAQAEQKLLSAADINSVVSASEKYPDYFRQLAYPPPIIFYQGQLPTAAARNRSLAVIGSPHCEQFGRNIAQAAGTVLAENDWQIISSLTDGCELNSIQGALTETGTVGAVLASGLAAENSKQKLVAEILSASGFILSELAPSTAPQAEFRSLRGRLQSSLAAGLFLVETEQDGSEITTVESALEHNISVYIWEPTDPSRLPAEKISGNLQLLNSRAVNSISCPRQLASELPKLAEDD